MTDPYKELFGYSPGHPWYYVLGGPRLTLKQIKAYAGSRDYRGYMAEDIDRAAARPEPQRSAALREIREKVIEDLTRDVAIYRRCVRELAQYRKATEITEAEPVCASIHTSMSLKFCHIQNCFAHLKALDELPAQQMELF
jgi:hypothetical protein